MVLLNADLGEGYDDADRNIMPFINQANIACGGHTGDRDSIATTAELAKRYGVSIGAHPSYVDRAHFGRKSVKIELGELEQQLFDQISRVADACLSLSTNMSHIKAHGALYNDANDQNAIMQLLLRQAKTFECALMVQCLPEHDMLATREYAETLGVALVLEGFADRAYLPTGRLAPRSLDGAVYSNLDAITTQALQLAQHQPIQCLNGQNQQLLLKIDSLCVHGDNQMAIDAAAKIHNALH